MDGLEGIGGWHGGAQDGWLSVTTNTLLGWSSAVRRRRAAWFTSTHGGRLPRPGDGSGPARRNGEAPTAHPRSCDSGDPTKTWTSTGVLHVVRHIGDELGQEEELSPSGAEFRNVGSSAPVFRLVPRRSAIGGSCQAPMLSSMLMG